MKIILKDNRHYVVRFDKGEEVVAGLQDFMVKEQVKGCAFYGIGTCTEVGLAFYNKNLKNYREKPYLEDLEIISFQGNGSWLDGKPIVHAHGMFGRTDFTVLGGHVFKIITSATCEIFAIVLDGELKRGKNEEFNLNLLV